MSRSLWKLKQYRAPLKDKKLLKKRLFDKVKHAVAENKYWNYDASLLIMFPKTDEDMEKLEEAVHESALTPLQFKYFVPKSHCKMLHFYDDLTSLEKQMLDCPLEDEIVDFAQQWLLEIDSEPLRDQVQDEVNKVIEAIGGSNIPPQPYSVDDVCEFLLVEKAFYASVSLGLKRVSRLLFDQLQGYDESSLEYLVNPALFTLVASSNDVHILSDMHDIVSSVGLLEGFDNVLDIEAAHASYQWFSKLVVDVEAFKVDQDTKSLVQCNCDFEFSLDPVVNFYCSLTRQEKFQYAEKFADLFCQSS